MITDPIDNLRRSIEYTSKVYGVSEEALAFKRKRAESTLVQPSAADWALYHEARELLEKVEANPFIFLDVAEFNEPEPYPVQGEYVESEDEWLRRIDALAATRGVPSDIVRALSLAEFQAINAHFRHDSQEKL